MRQYQKGKTNLDFTEARDNEWQWHQVGHMQICTLLQTDNHASIPPLSFLHAGCPSCLPTNSAKALILKLSIILKMEPVYNHFPLQLKVFRLIYMTYIVHMNVVNLFANIVHMNVVNLFTQVRLAIK